MFLEVTQAKHLSRYILEISFNNGEQKTVDLEGVLQGEVFEPLQDISLFKNFSIPHNTIEWSTGADLAPEFLYELALKQSTETTH